MMKIAFALAFSLFLISLSAENLKKNTEVWYTGCVEPAKSVDLSFGHFGRIMEIKPVGFMTNRSVALTGADENDFVVKGDIVAKQDDTLYKNQLKIAEAEGRAAQAAFAAAKASFERNKGLAEKNAISKMALDRSEKEFKGARAALTTAEAALETAKYHLERCYLRAPFSGQIEEKYCSVGMWVGPGKKVLRLTLTSMVRIRIPVPDKLLRNIGVTDSILLYPPGKKEPVGVWFDTLIYPSGSNEPVGKTFQDLSPDREHLYVFAVNKLERVKPLTENQKKLPKINRIVFVSQLNASSKSAPLWVPQQALRQDDKGQWFVWRAKGQKMAQPGNPISQEFSVERVSVAPGDKLRDFGIYKYRLLNDSGSLEALQLVLPEMDVLIKEGDRVVVEELQWLFSSGDQVRVKIPDAKGLLK